MMVLSKAPSLDMGNGVGVPYDVQQYLPEKKGVPFLDTHADLRGATGMMRSKVMTL